MFPQAPCALGNAFLWGLCRSRCTEPCVWVMDTTNNQGGHASCLSRTSSFHWVPPVNLFQFGKQITGSLLPPRALNPGSGAHSSEPAFSAASPPGPEPLPGAAASLSFPKAALPGVSSPAGSPTPSFNSFSSPLSYIQGLSWARALSPGLLSPPCRSLPGNLVRCSGLEEPSMC